jgi:hypothetical protein
VFIDRFMVLVKDSTALSNDVAKVYWVTVFKVGGEGKPEDEVVIFPDARILLSFDVEFSNSDDLMGKSCSIPLNPTRWQAMVSNWQNIQVRKLSPPEPEALVWLDAYRPAVAAKIREAR